MRKIILLILFIITLAFLVDKGNRDYRTIVIEQKGWNWIK